MSKFKLLNSGGFTCTSGLDFSTSIIVEGFRDDGAGDPTVAVELEELVRVGAVPDRDTQKGENYLLHFFLGYEIKEIKE